MHLRFLFAFLVLGATAAPAQVSRDTLSDLKLGQWQQHLPWQRVRYVTNSPDKVYCATEWAVVEIDKTDRSPRFLTKVEGLSDIGMGVIRFNPAANVLVLTYSNSNIDLWRPDAGGSVTNMPFIQKNTTLIGDKKIYDIFFEGKSAYLACGFGVVKLNLEREEVEYTVFTGRVVRSFAVFDGYFYMGTEDGMFRLSTSYDNPADFGQWIFMDEKVGFPAAYEVGPMAVFGGNLFFGSDKNLMRFDGGTLETIESHPTQSVRYLTTEGAGLVVGWKEQFVGRVQYRDASGSATEIQTPCEAIRPLYAVEDGSRKFWFADDLEDFRFYDLTKNQCDRFRYNSPFNHQSTDISIAQGGKVFVATPGPASDLAPPYRRDGTYVFEAGGWSQFSILTNPELQAGDCYADMWRVAAHPEEDVFYVGSWVGGLIENATGAVKCFTKDNSILQNAGASGPTRTAIGGLAFDADNNLWISNYDAQAPIAVRKADGSFRNFAGATANNLLQVVVDQSGYKWFVIGLGGGVLVYDSGDDIDSPGDDRYRVITTSNSNLPSNTVNCLAVDLDGDVWIGTQKGVISFECGSNVFDETNCKGSLRIIKVDDFNGYLLETEDVRTIAVDGANRKWFGTFNGIFVLAADVTEQVGRFTATNSPLFDNNITDIAINPANGEAWIGTEKGLQVLRTEAVAGGKINSQKPYAYPNPVRPDYDGPIAIYGLARDANVKITDVSGKLVYEGTALGGQAIWDGRDYLGRRAASGVYLVFATSSESFDAPDAVIAKVVILN